MEAPPLPAVERRCLCASPLTTSPLMSLSSRAGLGPVTPATGSSSYTWHVPQTNICVHMKLAMVGRLEDELAEAELNGVLLGTRAHVGEKLILTIEDYELVKPAPQRTAAREEAALTNLFAQWAESPKRRMYAIGLFRKPRDGSLELSHTDRDFLERSLRAANTVVLLASHLPGESKRGALLAWQRSPSNEEIHSLRFPFSRQELMWGAPDRGRSGLIEREPAPLVPLNPSTGAGHEPARTPSATIREIAPPLLSPPPSYRIMSSPGRARHSKAWIVSLLLILSAIGLLAFAFRDNLTRAFGPLRGDIAAEQPTSNLGLRALDTPSELTISWNHSLPFLTPASTGTLTISAGDEERVITLDAAFLREGKVTSAPLNRDLTVRLEIEGTAGRRFAESLRVLKNALPAPLVESSSPAIADEPLRVPRKRSGARARTNNDPAMTGAGLHAQPH